MLDPLALGSCTQEGMAAVLGRCTQEAMVAVSGPREGIAAGMVAVSGPCSVPVLSVGDVVEWGLVA